MMWRLLDDDQKDGWAVVVAVYSKFFKQAESCYPWGLDSSNYSWLDSREIKLVLAHRVGTLTLGADKIYEDRDLPQLIVFDGFYQWIYIIEFSIHIWCLLSIWLIHCYYALMINKCSICYLRTGCKKLLEKVRKFGRSVHTLIHPPSQCGCCVQQKMHFYSHLWFCALASNQFDWDY